MSGPLGDGIGQVELIDHMGTDLTVVNAARVSLRKTSTWEERGSFVLQLPGKLNGKDVGLIQYLARHGHWTPFSQPQVSLRVKMPIFVARQWFKHQVGFTRNEVSRRYVDDEPEFFLPTEWRSRPTGGVKQGSGPVLDPGLAAFTECVEAKYKNDLRVYEWLLERGVAPEQARIVLPQAMYTEFVETASLYAYSRLCKERLAPNAQYEIRQYAHAVSLIMQELFPTSWAALNGTDPEA